MLLKTQSERNTPANINVNQEIQKPLIKLALKIKSSILVATDDHTATTLKFSTKALQKSETSSFVIKKLFNKNKHSIFHINFKHADQSMTCK